jgi:hypothetical protein
MAQQFPGMVRIALSQSRLLTILLLAAHGFCAGGLLLWPGPGWVRLGLLVLIFIALLRALRHEAWRQSPQAITRVDLEGGGRLRFMARNRPTLIGAPPAGQLCGSLWGYFALSPGERWGCALLCGGTRCHPSGLQSHSTGFAAPSVIMSGY